MLDVDFFDPRVGANISGGALEFARKFDHTNLKPNATGADISKLCTEAREHAFAAVCIALRWTPMAVELLSEDGNQSVKICTVIGFPHGNTDTKTKSFEAERAVESGASEIDMVISVGDLIDGNHDYIVSDISAVRTAIGSPDVTLKVILETGYLDTGQIRTGCGLAVSAGADYVKTSTGFGPTGAMIETVSLMRESVGDGVGVKAAGGIKTLKDAQAMLDAGATRLGCSSSTSVMNEYLAKYA